MFVDIIGNEFSQGYETGVKARFFSLFLAVFLGLAKTALFVIPRRDSGLILGLKPCQLFGQCFVMRTGYGTAAEPKPAKIA